MDIVNQQARRGVKWGVGGLEMAYPMAGHVDPVEGHVVKDLYHSA